MVLNGKEFKQYVRILQEISRYDDNMWDDVYEWDPIHDWSKRYDVTEAVGNALYETVQKFIFGRNINN